MPETHVTHCRPINDLPFQTTLPHPVLQLRGVQYSMGNHVYLERKHPTNIKEIRKCWGNEIRTELTGEISANAPVLP